MDLVTIYTVFAFYYFESATASWDEWWTYDGISGPQYWGRINPDWGVCQRGRRQSPIDVDPTRLLHDPHLTHVHVDANKIGGWLVNTGQSLVFRCRPDAASAANLTGGPLAYRYRFHELRLHFGTSDAAGSEHHLNGHSFPAEIQIYGFNAELFHNMTEAWRRAHGVAVISLMVQIGEAIEPSSDLRIVTSVFSKVLHKGSEVEIGHLSLRSLLPDTPHYMTYEGSTTHPGCWETATWIIYNKPVYVTKQEMYALRRLTQGTAQNPKAPLGNNVRPLQPLNQRTVRTNIDFTRITSLSSDKSCPISMKREMHYKRNPMLIN